MNRIALRNSAAALLVSAFALLPAHSQVEPEAQPAAPVTKPKLIAGSLYVPASSLNPTSASPRKVHTNLRVLLTNSPNPDEAPPYTGYAYETPASLACLYGVVTSITGCNPNSTVNTPSGGSQTIAIVDAYDDPDAYGDLAYFSDLFGLPLNPGKFHVVYAGGSQPTVDYTGGWELEEALDIEYAHAMAPNATLYLVEANSSAYSDLLVAVKVATNLVQCGETTTCPTTATGKGEVSMSWGGSEFSGETSYDSDFIGKNVVYLAAAGDSAGTIYPCVSPNVVCVGGTSTARSLATGNLIQEIAWSDGGGGISQYEAVPSFQSSIPAISSLVGKFRGVPDISADANPYTGVWVYDSFPMDLEWFPSSWWLVGGTSVATPTVAGIINAAGHFSASSSAEETSIYTNRAVAADFNDIAYGACGPYSAYFSATGWDFCTGVGSPKGLAGK
jgi:subtilase family serine protease